MRRRRGYLLAVVLAVGGLCLFLLVAAGLQTSEFTLYEEEFHAQEAQDASLALQETAMDRLMYEPDWQEGFGKTEFSDPDSSAWMTFDPRSGQPWSLNNVAGKKAARGWQDRTVPAGQAHLVSRALSPDPDPGNPFDDSDALGVVRQSLVQAYRRYWLEDFGPDRRDQPRHEWTFSGPDHLVRGGYLLLGGNDRTDGIFAEAGEPWWEDYDLEAEVAYYGGQGFGLLVRSHGSDGYAALISPIQGRDACVGASVQFFTTGPFGRGWAPFSDGPPDATVVVDGQDPAALNPFLTQGPEYERVRNLLNVHMVPKYTLPLGFWRLRLSVEGGESRLLELRVASLGCDPRTRTLYETGVERTFTTALPEGEGHRKGRIGFFCEPRTRIGITRVRVDKRGAAMVTVPATWTDR